MSPMTSLVLRGDFGTISIMAAYPTMRAQQAHACVPMRRDLVCQYVQTQGKD
jgi:hypothetical protein